MSTLASFSSNIARLIEAIGGAEFPELLIGTIKSLVPVEDATVIVYPEEGLPVVEYFEIPEESGETTLHHFVKGAFLLDPYYLAAVTDRRFGVFRLRELAPTGFRESEYYRNYYKNCTLQDECGYLMPLGDEGFINIALGKNRPRARFGKKELDLLRDALPALQSLCQQHWQREDRQDSPEGISLRQQMGQALADFGTSLLTERETQVIHLVLHGHSTKTVAEKLNISMETVKLHRKHAYAKLEVGSQAELFYLFLDSLMSATNYTGGDALVEYMQPPGSNAQ